MATEGEFTEASVVASASAPSSPPRNQVKGSRQTFLDEFEFSQMPYQHQDSKYSNFTAGAPSCSSPSSLIDVRNISTPFTKTRNKTGADLDVPPAPRKNRISPNTALKSRELYLNLSGDVCGYPNSDDNEQEHPEVACETNLFGGDSSAGRRKTQLSFQDESSCDRQALQARSLDFGEVGEAEEAAATTTRTKQQHQQPRTRKEKQVRVKELEKYFRRLDVESCESMKAQPQPASGCMLVPKTKDANQLVEDDEAVDPLILGSPETTGVVFQKNTFNVQRKRHFGEISSPTVPATPAIDFKEQKRDEWLELN